MNAKQWTWIYKKVRGYFEKYSGKPPDDQAVTELMDTYFDIMDVTEKSREASPDLDKQITAVFKLLFDIMQALEMEKKPI